MFTDNNKKWRLWRHQGRIRHYKPDPWYTCNATLGYPGTNIWHRWGELSLLTKRLKGIKPYRKLCSTMKKWKLTLWLTGKLALHFAYLWTLKLEPIPHQIIFHNTRGMLGQSMFPNLILWCTTTCICKQYMYDIHFRNGTMTVRKAICAQPVLYSCSVLF